MKKAKGGYILEHNGASIIYKTKREAEQALLRVTLGAMGAETPSDEKKPEKKPASRVIEGEASRIIGDDEQKDFTDIMKGDARGFVMYVNLDNGNALARMSKVTKHLVMATLPTLLKIENEGEAVASCMSFIQGMKHAKDHVEGKCGEHEEE